MSRNAQPDSAHDPSSEPGLRNPARDKARMGDEQYNVTPPRSAVRSPNPGDDSPQRCAICEGELDGSSKSYRIDGKEYIYHFCSAECYERWNRAGGSK